ncbi:Protein of uncharacterised function (DUF1153) [Comamonas aquatica]|nr:Protein of uncharacterised function (DUF1153) [Comamonas aquatica]
MKDQEEVKRWTAKRKSALVLEIIQGKTTVSEASRAYDLMPSEIESWVEEGKRVWKTPCELSLKMCVSSTSVNCVICKRHMARQCWSYVLEKLQALLDEEGR